MRAWEERRATQGSSVEDDVRDLYAVDAEPMEVRRGVIGGVMEMKTCIRNIRFILALKKEEK